LKKFTTYTNKWKNDPQTEKQISKSATPTPIEELLKISPKVSPDEAWVRVRGKQNEYKLNLELPEPQQANPNKQIRFYKPLSDIKKVSAYLFDDPDVPSTEVGEKCFDSILEKAKK